MYIQKISMLCVTLAVLNSIASADVLKIVHDTSWRAIGPVSNSEGGSIDSKGLAWESVNSGWNSDPSFDDSGPSIGTLSTWTDAVFNFSPPSVPGQAGHPIWVDGTGFNGATPAYFRRTFAINGVPTTGSITLQSIDDDAKIYVNGNLVINDTDGMVTSLPPVDVLSFLQSGDNLIAVKAHDSLGLGEGLELIVDSTFVPGELVPVGLCETLSLSGGSSVAGGLDFKFEEVTSSGFLTSDENPVFDLELVDFLLPTDPLQIWEINFTGVFVDGVTITFGYDDSTFLPGVSEEDLVIYHFSNGTFEKLSGIVDPVANTFTVSGITGFSPFILGVSSAIPEPSSFIILCFGVLSLYMRRRRKFR